MKYNLSLLAKEVMKSRGFATEFPRDVFQQLQSIRSPARPIENCEDLRSLLWFSIDNDASQDLDQLTYMEKTKDGKRILYVAVADVEALVAKDSPIDLHAKINTTSIYTPAKIFPMIPEKLCFDWTSLNENEDRLAIVIKIHMDSKGNVEDASVFQALVRNRAKLSYHSVGNWLGGQGKIPEKVKNIPGLEKGLRLQHETAQILQQKRHLLGSLTLHPIEIEARFTEDRQIYLEPPSHNFAHQIIESFMIAANSVVARQLRAAKIPSLRRVVRTPKRWNRIVEIASSFGTKLPQDPDPKALDAFLLLRKKADFDSFADLSLVMIKLLGRGEYIVEMLGDPFVGHFNLGLSEYTHSTAPNRRFVDLVSIRQCKALIHGNKNPYSFIELQEISQHCTAQEDSALKVERHLNKSAAAIYLSPHIGTLYQGIITGSSEKGTWVRIFSPPVEGKIIHGFEHLDVGDRVQVQLQSVDVPKGFINFVAKK